MAGRVIRTKGLTMGVPQFYRDFVLPAVADWRHHHLSIRHLIWALSEFDNLAEHFLLAENPSVKRHEMSVRRDDLGQDCTAVVVARDVHDTHKHGTLSRRSATLKQGQRPKQAWRGGAFSSAFSSAFDIGEPVLLIEDDSGQQHFADDVVDELQRYWLIRLGALN